MGNSSSPRKRRSACRTWRTNRPKTLGSAYHKKPIPAIPARAKTWHCPVLTATDDPKSKTTLSITLPRRDAHGHEVLVPGENYLFSALLRADGLQSTSSYFITIHADNQRPISVLRDVPSTAPTFACPGAFQRIGILPGRLPVRSQRHLHHRYRHQRSGQGDAAGSAIFQRRSDGRRLYGRKVVQAAQLGRIVGPNEHDFTVVKPDNMFSLAGLNYLVHGFIPLRQWLMPALAWSTVDRRVVSRLFRLQRADAQAMGGKRALHLPDEYLPAAVVQRGGRGSGVRGIFRNKIYVDRLLPSSCRWCC